MSTFVSLIKTFSKKRLLADVKGIAEACLGPCQIYMKDFFSENTLMLKLANYFRKKLHHRYFTEY